MRFQNYRFTIHFSDACEGPARGSSFALSLGERAEAVKIVLQRLGNLCGIGKPGLSKKQDVVAVAKFGNLLVSKLGRGKAVDVP